jgi:hypothetical protein
VNPKEFGRLEPVHLREGWEKEDANFTPWLAQPENIAFLSMELGLDIEVIEQEKFVGPFRADIYARDRYTDQKIIIENQLEATDHPHLGQIITYSSGLNASTCIWIAKKFCEEHRAAIDWLNQNTVEGINFFGIEIQLWRIGNSPIAPRFKVVAKPNNWIKSIRRSIDSGSPTDYKMVQMRFWEKFKEFLAERDPLIRAENPKPQSGMQIATTFGDIRLFAGINLREKNIGINIHFINENSNELFSILKEKYEPEIKQRFKDTLEFHEVIGKKPYLRLLNSSDPNDETLWESQFSWLTENIKICLDFFPRRLKEIRDDLNNNSIQ